MPLTEENFRNPQNDAALLEEFEEIASAVTVDPEEVKRRIAAGNTQAQLIAYADSIWKAALEDDAKLIKGWLTNTETRKAGAEDRVERCKKEVEAMVAKGNGVRGQFQGGVARTVMGPKDKIEKSILLVIVFVLLVVGYASTVSLLHEQMGWELWLSLVIPFSGVVLLAFVVKKVLVQILEINEKAYLVAFFSTAGISLVCLLVFFYLLSTEYESSQTLDLVGVDSPPEGGHGTAMRFLFGLLADSFGAAALYARAHHITKRCTSMDGEVPSPDFLAREKELDEARNVAQLWASRIALANTLLTRLDAARESLHNAVNMAYQR